MKASLEPMGLRATTEIEVPGFSRRLRLGQDGLGSTYLGLSLDIYRAKLRDKKHVSILLDGALCTLEAAMTFYVPVNPWLFTLPTFSQHAGQLRQEEGMRDVIREHIPSLVPFLTGPITQCPGLDIVDLGGDEGFGYRYSDQKMQEYVGEYAQLLLKRGHVTTEAEALGLLSLLLGNSLTHQLGLNARSNPSPSPIVEPRPKRLPKPQRGKAQAKPSCGPIDAFLKKKER
ncbi:hypothetical protein GMRT_23450 [Giardia muris]|uniref:Uncharacterized protein n=1 Tax=Giardia muris TaxID=5742 RepID=A0A4Z1SPT6_GIAMU|nr:hypothetical protein GMRT_23450 [Giardia muris]|eukprot:TNJ27844.1 hypothetical protein GMRT_23450 [Giardia muris]